MSLTVVSYEHVRLKLDSQMSFTLIYASVVKCIVLSSNVAVFSKQSVAVLSNRTGDEQGNV